MSTETPNLVPLTPIEKAFFKIAADSDGDCTCYVAVRLDAFIEQEPMRAALTALQQRHPKLRAKLVEQDNGEWFYEQRNDAPAIPCEISDVDAELPVRVEDPAVWHQAVLDNHAVPLIRVRVFRNRPQNASIVVVTIPHALGDATSLTRLVTDLLAYYARARAGREPVAVEALPAVSIEGIARGGTFWSRLGTLRRAIGFTREYRRGFVDLPSAGGEPALPHCHRWSLSAKATMSLIQQCRREDSSIFGALLAASLLALNEALDQSSVRAVWRCPIDIRPRLRGATGPLTLEDVGAYCVIFQTLYDVDRKDSLWTLARRARTDLKTFEEGGGAGVLYGLLARMSRPRNSGGRIRRRLLFGVIRRLFRPKNPQLMEHRKRPTLQVSYGGGFYGGDESAGLGIRDWLLAIASARTGLSLMNSCYMMGSQLHFSFIGFDLAQDFWATYVASLRRLLQQAIDGTCPVENNQPTHPEKAPLS